MRCRTVAFAVIGLAALGLVPLQAQTQKVCLVGVSKNLCEGSLGGGVWSPLKCIGPKQVKCSTLTGTGTGLGSPVKTSGNNCDEAQELDGNLRTTLNVNLRQHPPLLEEGSFGGKFDLLKGGGIIASGTINATLGVGTHRPACDATCGKDCEKCYDASFNPSAQAWNIGTEGFMDGQVTAGVFKGCRIRWSFQGRFTAKGTQSGPTPPGPAWKFCGTVDGVLECPCG